MTFCFYFVQLKMGDSLQFAVFIYGLNMAIKQHVGFF